MTYIVELQDIVLAPWGPSSSSAVAELVFTHVIIFDCTTFNLEAGE